jgi:glutamine cyclotransferase
MKSPTRRTFLAGAAAVSLVSAAACARAADPPPAAPAGPEELVVKVLRSFPHDRGAFTQGLLWHDGRLYESTGLPGRSSLRRVELETGKVEAQVALKAPLFAEGLAQVDTRLVQLTWQDRRAFVWTLDAFHPVREYTYDGEGWGLCFDGRRLVMSDGSERLTFRDPQTFERQSDVVVTRGGEPLRLLNELECVDGLVYANVWQTDSIVRIDPATGRVTGWIDASGLLTDNERVAADVLNGIAYWPEQHSFLITGKLWPRLLEVQFVPRPASAR